MSNPVSRLQAKIHGSFMGDTLREWLLNSIHFPLANVILEMLLASPRVYLGKYDGYLMITASLVQAMIRAAWGRSAKRMRFYWVSNLIAPLLYTGIELWDEGVAVLDAHNHQAFWVFALLITFFQHQQRIHSGFISQLCILSENMVRTSILLVMYIIFELSSGKPFDIALFVQDSSHQFMLITVPLLGLVVGGHHLLIDRYLSLLRETTTQLQRYSEWFLGAGRLSEAVDDERSLSLKRCSRVVLFMDIRGFTQWSEKRSPEEVVGMLNGYFELAERCWQGKPPLKTKYTADEIMAVFPSVSQLVEVLPVLDKELSEYFATYHLSVGAGVHYGEVVEGLIGSEGVKCFDVIGDTVNTGKRICDQAKAGEWLCSTAVANQWPSPELLISAGSFQLKGKSTPMQMFRVQLRSLDG